MPPRRFVAGDALSGPNAFDDLDLFALQRVQDEDLTLGIAMTDATPITMPNVVNAPRKGLPVTPKSAICRPSSHVIGR